MKLSVWPIDKMAVIALTLLLVAQAKAISIKNNGAVSEITVLVADSFNVGTSAPKSVLFFLSR